MIRQILGTAAVAKLLLVETRSWRRRPAASVVPLRALTGRPFAGSGKDQPRGPVSRSEKRGIPNV